MAANFEPGAELPELKVTPDRFLTVRYAGASGDFNPIHIDEEFAKSVGLPGRILHGLWSMAQVARAQTEAAGGPEQLKALSRPVPRHGRAGAGGRRHEQRDGGRGRRRDGRRPRRARATRGSSATRSRRSRWTDGAAGWGCSRHGVPVRGPAERPQAACADAVCRAAAPL